MELGEKLRQTRIAAGLSQRQLCADVITRNMLSQIENGSASPSVKTLCYLAQRLGRPVSYFLEEDAAVSFNQGLMEKAWLAYGENDRALAYDLLKDYRSPDPVYDRERALLQALTVLALAEQALEENRRPYARQLLEELPEEMPLRQLERTRGLLQLQLGLEAPKLPDLDRELLVRAEAALASGDAAGAERLLEAARDRRQPRWCLLRGQVSLTGKRYREAAEYLTLAEEVYPRETALPLEYCYRELGDYRSAYTYACKARSFLD